MPIEAWPGERTKGRRASPFRAGYVNTLDLLEAELNNLRAKDVVLQAFIGWQDIRNDGWPRSDARWRDPGVILTFTTPAGALSFPCDRYSDWQANLRAIALSLEALRAVDRYGVTRRAEQYQGWRQIEAPGVKSAFESAEAAARFIVIHSGSEFNVDRVIKEPEVRRISYRAAAAKLHPDRGGNLEQFVMLQQALAILDAVAKGATP